MRFPFKVGLKLYSINTDLIPEVESLWRKDYFQYIELYIIPGSYSSTHEKWYLCHIPFVIHAPHSVHGINLSLASQWKQNITRFREAQEFADKLNGDRIIVHGGHTGTITETIRQVSRLSDSRIILENKPKVGINGEVCVGWSPEEFHLASISGGFKGFALDFGHASCAALSLEQKPMDMVRSFLVFKPKIFHLSDGDPNSERDKHQNIGKGGFNIIDFLSVIPKGGFLTIETPRNKQNGLEDFVKDINSLRELL